ncbi:hypothetical protein VUJ46_10410 [Chryseobacterium sp. MYb264]|uniref:hypothetical protein n=1 Tax=Chryseobacterium sp. MYb264 TaxID=2745153 RepID=UPI002E13D74A|nr:hypothetical protein VUJ46_10410 [Chryseobacterium sp. MYb264]
MSEELYFIKINPVVAKINLYNKLCREEKTVLDFLEADSKTSLELIKNKIQGGIHSLSKEELLSLFSWIDNLCNADHEELKTQLFTNGIELFYEIPEDSQVKNFQQIASDYEKISQKNLNFITSSENFNQFLIYGIFFTTLSNKEKPEDNICYNFLKSDNKSLYLLAEEQFNANYFETVPNMNTYFSNLYDLTKYYNGSIIKLHHL